MRNFPQRGGRSFAGGRSGYVLVTVMFIMILIAVVALAMNRRSALQQRIASNVATSMKRQLALTSATEFACWRITQNHTWRTATNGEAFVYDGTTNTLTVLTVTASGTSTVISVSAALPDGSRVQRSFFSVQAPTNLLFIADRANHCIRKVGNNGAITTVAGLGGSAGSSGDAGPATNALLNSPRGLWVNPDGALYIADTANHRVRMVNATGVISRVAGSSAGGAGDGGAATNATLDSPAGVWGDAAGNLFIADTGNNKIRRISAGIIATYAGTGVQGYRGDWGAAVSARLNQPRGVYVDRLGDVYIADSENCLVRKVTASSGVINSVAGWTFFNLTWCGGNVSQLDSPQGVCVDGTGSMLIGDRDNHRIGTVLGGYLETLLGLLGVAGYTGDSGPASLATLNSPHGVCVDHNGNTYIADRDNHVIRKVDGQTGIITTFAGNGLSGFSGDGGPATSARLNGPTGVAALYVPPKLTRIVAAY